MSKKLYPTISPYPGAKAGYVGEVIAEILPYEGIKQYFEVFGGMANIILHKAPHPEEFYNDLNQKLTTLMYVLSDGTLSNQLFQLMLIQQSITTNPDLITQNSQVNTCFHLIAIL